MSTFLTDHEMPRPGVGNLEDEVEDEDADENNTGDENSQVCIYAFFISF